MKQALILGFEDIDELSEILANKIIARIENSESLKASKPEKNSLLTTKQIAKYLNVSTQSILNWVKRDTDPLPVHYVGADPRFDLKEIKEWSKREADRKLHKHTKNSA